MRKKEMLKVFQVLYAVFTFAMLLFCALTIVPDAFGAAPLHDLSLIRNSSTTITSYSIFGISQLIMNYTFHDGVYDIMQDYNLTIIFNGQPNFTLPQTILHYTFDNDSYYSADAYQENVSVVAPTNTTGQTEGQWTGGGVAGYDNNWETATSSSQAGNFYPMYLNYTIPLLSNRTIIWEIKAGGSSPIPIVNVTFDIPEDQGVVILKMNGSNTPDWLNFSYKNITGEWVTVWQNKTAGAFFEEQIYYWEYVSSAGFAGTFTNDTSLARQNRTGLGRNVMNDSSFRGNAYRFNGTGNFSIPFEYNHEQNTTVIIKIRPNLTGTSEDELISSKGMTVYVNNTGKTLCTRLVGFNSFFEPCEDYDCAGNNILTQNSTVDVDIIGTWSHATFGIDYHFYVYANGTLVHEAGGCAPNDGISNMVLGRNYRGSMDNFLVYNTPLGAQQRQITQNDSVTINNLAVGLYSANIDYNSVNGTFSSNSSTTNITAGVQLNFTFFDEDFGEQFTWINISFRMISPIYNANYTVTNGNLILPDFANFSIYNVYYSSIYHPQRMTTLVINYLEEYQNYALYLGNSTTQVTATVYDESNKKIGGVRIRYLKYFPINNSYSEVGQAMTNFDGITQMPLILNTQLYKFILEYQDRIVLSTLETYIYSTSIEFQINLRTTAGDEFFRTRNISYSLQFDEGSNQFQYTYINENNDTVQSCLHIYRTTGLGDYLVNDSCNSADTGYLYSSVDAVNGTSYRADTYIDTGTGEQILDSKTHTFLNNNIFGDQGIFYQILLTIPIAFVGYWSIGWAVILVPASLIFGSILGLHQIPMFILIGLTILSVILFMVVERRQ
jgi:hypothetical protein